MKTKVRMNPTVEMLGRWPGLRGCSDRELSDLAQLVEDVTLEPGRVLTRAGRAGAQAFMIISGAVEVEIDGEVVATIGPESFVGEMALLEDDVRTATVTTTEPTRVLVLSRRAFQAVVSKPSVTSRMARQLAHRVRELDGAPSRRHG